jgi:hypothetical protein
MRADAQAKWFCSELLFAALAAVGSAPLCRIKQWQVYPGLLAYSPMLTYLRSAVVPDYKNLSGTQELKKSDPDFLSSKLSEAPLGV